MAVDGVRWRSHPRHGRYPRSLRNRRPQPSPRAGPIHPLEPLRLRHGYDASPHGLLLRPRRRDRRRLSPRPRLEHRRHKTASHRHPRRHWSRIRPQRLAPPPRPAQSPHRCQRPLARRARLASFPNPRALWRSRRLLRQQRRSPIGPLRRPLLVGLRLLDHRHRTPRAGTQPKRTPPSPRRFSWPSRSQRR